MQTKENRGWIGVDLDGTLAEWRSGDSIHRIGNPIPAMVNRVKNWIANGRKVKVFTARVAYDSKPQRDMISAWTKQHIGVALEATAKKDPQMTELWDDRAIQVVANKGEPLNHITPRCIVCAYPVVDPFTFTDSVKSDARFTHPEQRAHIACVEKVLERHLLSADFPETPNNTTIRHVLLCHE